MPQVQAGRLPGDVYFLQKAMPGEHGETSTNENDQANLAFLWTSTTVKRSFYL